jgi:hypothetical protein
MSSRVLGPKTLTSAEALEQYRRVKLDGSGNVVYADAADGDSWIGTTEHAVPTATPVAILTRTAEGTRFFTASATEAIDAGDKLYPADDGKVTKTAGALKALGFTALADGSAAADGDIFEAIPGARPGGGAIAAGANLTAVPATFADLAAVQTYLVTLRGEIEVRLDALEVAAL